MSKRDTDNLATMATDLQAENARLRAEVADLQASNASLREQGRRAEVERDAALARLAEKTADLARLWLAREDIERERDEARIEAQRLRDKVNRMVRSASLEDIQGVKG